MDAQLSHVLKQDEDDWTWVREEETVMTISEIEEKLSISNLKIKKEDQLGDVYDRFKMYCANKICINRNEDEE